MVICSYLKIQSRHSLHPNNLSLERPSRIKMPLFSFEKPSQVSIRNKPIHFKVIPLNSIKISQTSHTTHLNWLRRNISTISNCMAPSLEVFFLTSSVATLALTVHFAKRVEGNLQSQENNRLTIDPEKSAQELDSNKEKDQILKEILELSKFDKKKRIPALLKFMDRSDLEIRLICLDEISEVLKGNLLSLTELIEMEDQLSKKFREYSNIYEFYKISQVYSSVIDAIFGLTQEFSLNRQYTFRSHAKELRKKCTADFPSLEADVLRTHLKAKYLTKKDVPLFWALLIETTVHKLSKKVLKILNFCYRLFYGLNKTSPLVSVKSPTMHHLRISQLFSLGLTTLNLSQAPYGFQKLSDCQKLVKNENLNTKEFDQILNDLSELRDDFNKNSNIFQSHEDREWNEWLFFYEVFEIMHSIIKKEKIGIESQKAVAELIAKWAQDVRISSWKIVFKILEILPSLSRNKLLDEKSLKQLEVRWQLSPSVENPILNPNAAAQLFEAREKRKVIDEEIYKVRKKYKETFIEAIHRYFSDVFFNK
jgi:hypothetical protein